MSEMKMEARSTSAADSTLPRSRLRSVADATALKTVTMIYEDRAAWTARAQRSGFSAGGAEAASFWLLGRDEIGRTYGDLREAAPELDFHLLSIEDFLYDTNAILSKERNRHLLWNITDGQANFRGSHIVNFAVLSGLSYFGCPPFAQALGQDKFKLFSLCRQIGVRVPPSALVENRKIVSAFLDESDAGPFFVKPNSGGNKIGLSANSLCVDLPDALEQARIAGAGLRDRMIVQNFIRGIEIRVTFVNANPSAAAPELGFDLIDDQPDAFINAEERDSKYDAFHDFLSWNGISAQRRESIATAMREAIFTIARHVRLKDYFAFDFRVDTHDRAFLIDFNPGAFLYGDDVEGYTRQAFSLSLPKAIVEAMRNAHAGNSGHAFECRNAPFRL